ncbi:hypothetical protein X737_20885 [Mesorhizobium sp. L48C026A00]|nr:hypothetical protein X737_20885 [Mesorhizobium sp. L48C026A00]
MGGSDDAGQAGIRSAAHLDLAESCLCVMTTTALHRQLTDKCAVFDCEKPMLARRNAIAAVAGSARN